MLTLFFGPKQERILLKSKLTVRDAIHLLVRHSMKSEATQDIDGLSLFDHRLPDALPLDATLQQCGVLSNDLLDRGCFSRVSCSETLQNGGEDGEDGTKGEAGKEREEREVRPGEFEAIVAEGCRAHLQRPGTRRPRVRQELHHLGGDARLPECATGARGDARGDGGVLSGRLQ